MRTVDQLIEGLESLILAALDELCTLDSQGVAQVEALGELQRAIADLERHCDLDIATRRRIRDAREMLDRIAEVSALRRTIRTDVEQVRSQRTH